MITPAGETDPNNPEQQTSFEQNLVLIKDFINRQLEGVEPYVENEEREVRQSPTLQSASGIAIGCSSQRTLDEDEQAEEGGYEHVVMSNGLSSSMRWLYFNKDGTLGLAISEENKQVELDELTLEQAKANPDFQETVAHAINAIAETGQCKKEYRRYALPAEVTIDNLSASDRKVYGGLLQENSGLVAEEPELLPKYRMTTSEGDQWLASSVLSVAGGQSGDRIYTILYRLDPDEPKDISAHIVYTSRSQGVWRALPHLNKDGWHNKGYDSEAVLNLPITLQKSLWRLTAEQSLQYRGREVYATLSSLTAQTYDAYLAGAESDFIEVSDDDTESPKLPTKTETLDEAFSFTSPLYGDVSASIVPSRDGTIRYLILQEKDGAKWVGMAEPVDAQMLDSFILDKTIRPRWLLYTPAVENIDKIYRDNRARAAASIAIQALTGTI
jgi:hypothetical protein